METLCYKIWSWMYMSLCIFRHCSGFILIMMFVCHASAGLSGPQMSSYAISQKEKEWIQMFISLVSAIWDHRQMPLILLWGFLCEFFLTVCSYLSPFCNWTLQSVTRRPIACDRPGNAENSITESESVGFVVCPIMSQCF